MATGRYATLTPLPFSAPAATEMERVFERILAIRASQGRKGDILDESYAKVSDYIKLSEKLSNESEQLPLSLGSAWALECRANHGFHYHSYSTQDPSLSFRRLLFFSDQGFTAEFFPYDQALRQALGPLERFIMHGPSFAELEFDGRIVHRFRPLSNGRLFAYSIHHNDLSTDDHAASTQTHEVLDIEPPEVIQHTLRSEE
jgi:hypothetical protein